MSDFVKLATEARKSGALDLSTVLRMIDEPSRAEILRMLSAHVMFARTGMRRLDALDELALAVVAYMGWNETQKGGGS